MEYEIRTGTHLEYGCNDCNVKLFYGTLAVRFKFVLELSAVLGVGRLPEDAYSCWTTLVQFV